MADIAKTVEIVFKGDIGDAQKKVEDLGKSLDKIGQTDGQNVEALNQQVQNIGESAGSAQQSTDALGGSLGELDESANAATQRVTDLDASLTAAGAAGAGIRVMLGLYAALGAVLIVAGSEVTEFKTRVDNLKDPALGSEEAFESLKRVVGELETSFRATSNLYVDFISSLEQSGFALGVAEDAFIGIFQAVKSQGGGLKEAEKALEAFVKVTKDGRIDLKELDDTLGSIPGVLRVFAQELGVSDDELRKLASSGQLGREEISLLARALREEDYGDLTPVVDAFTSLWNTIKLVAVDFGAEGAFGFAVSGLVTLLRGVELVFTQGAAGVELFAKALALVDATLKGNVGLKDFQEFSKEIWDDFTDKVGKAELKARGLTAEITKGSREVADSGKNYKALAEDVEDSVDSMAGDAARLEKEWEKAQKEIDALLKKMGIDPNIFKNPVNEAISDFERLASKAGITGDQILAGLAGTMRKLPQEASIQPYIEVLQKALAEGTISVEEYASGVSLLITKATGLSPSLDPATESIKEQSKALDKAKESAEKAEKAQRDYALELEKIASNERIKTIEFNVELKIANLQEGTKRIQAAFESIDNTVSVTGQSLNELFGLLGDLDNIGFKAQTAIRDQLEIQNKRQDDALKLQKALTEAQIENIRAQTAALNKSDALIKVDGAGLQPHLEAFMWEILRAIQVRVNRDGMAMLLGS